jgi:dTDP-4-dehydrorhamnose reductase
MKLWILGKNGLVGQTLTAKATQQAINFIATSHHEVDITDLRQIQSFATTQKISHIINCAAYTLVDEAESHPKLAYLINADGPKYLGQVGRSLGIRVIHISTDYVFDGTHHTPYKEDDVCRPLSVYGHSKWWGEVKLLQEMPSACIVRTSWVFGPKGKTFLSTLINRLKGQETLSVIADQRSRPTYCADLCEVLLMLKEHSGIFHFANQGSYSRFELALSMKKELERQGVPLACKEIIPIDASSSSFVAPRPLYSIFDTNKVEHTLKILPRSWEEIMKEACHG